MRVLTLENWSRPAGNDIFSLVKNTEVCNYADDTTLFACDSDVNNVQYKLEADASRLPSGLLVACEAT